MKSLKTTIAVIVLIFANAAGAANNGHGYKKHNYKPRHDLYEYARVTNVQPIYREVEVSRPVRECWQEPVYHTRSRPRRSAGGMLVGGLLGGFIGHQFGKGRTNKVATVVGTIVGAQIGHNAVNGHSGHDSREVARYEEHCKTRHEVGYEEVIDGYDVTYRYRGSSYQIEMPYDPGKRIKMRIQFAPVI
jgi:uncharacterized protein YcfJ